MLVRISEGVLEVPTPSCCPSCTAADGEHLHVLVHPTGMTPPETLLRHSRQSCQFLGLAAYSVPAQKDKRYDPNQALKGSARGIGIGTGISVRHRPTRGVAWLHGGWLEVATLEGWRHFSQHGQLRRIDSAPSIRSCPMPGCVRDLAALAPMLVMLPRLAPSQMRPENRSAQNQGDAQGDEKRTTNAHVARRIRRGRGEFIDGGWCRRYDPNVMARRAWNPAIDNARQQRLCSR
ncbi:hypothetical protein EDB80DRAFT_827897 [Ilyonectria destructans]|nr:hypothetical protein EDB80DRAFT_827897 [Ilyonectria destructans]